MATIVSPQPAQSQKQPAALEGIHHVTAITADARQNLRFYTQVLGLRLVKKTVNFDDPTSYHLYYGTELGAPGTTLTFFAWPGATRGRTGAGETVAVAFSVPPGSLDHWRDRLTAEGLSVLRDDSRFGQELIEFEDPDGIRLQLVASADERAAWSLGPVPEGHAIRGIDSVAVRVRTAELTAALLTGPMGFRSVGEDGGRRRFAAGGGAAGALLDVLTEGEAPRPRLGAGSIHHVAWRTPSDATELAWRQKLLDQGFNVSPIMDRSYFRSIYYREPGGVLFEIATDGPGFTMDEPADRLGTELKLPPALESMRAQIQAALPPLE